MFNCVKKTAHQNIYAIFFIQVQIIQIIPRSFENGNFLVQRPNSSFMKFCPVFPEICRGQVHVPWKERKKERKRLTIIIIRNGAKTISLLDMTENRIFTLCCMIT
jgi:hypothetical protein